MLAVQNLSYTHPNKDQLFEAINLAFPHSGKVALIGNNGAGKSTFLKILAGRLSPSQGSVQTSSVPFYVPQHFGQFDEATISQALQIDNKLQALHGILKGDLTAHNLEVLDEDWNIEERSREALSAWGMEGFSFTQPMRTLSGGEKTKLFLAGITIHQPEIILLDEPTNHLDQSSREKLYGNIRSSSATLVVVSHDRYLLNLLDHVYTLDNRGVVSYGGNYDFYLEQRKQEEEVLHHAIRSREKSLKKALKTERESLERKQKLDARGKSKQDKAGIPRIVKNSLKDQAEKSSTKLKDSHREKIAHISDEVSRFRQELPVANKMKMDFEGSGTHQGKLLVEVKEINFTYGKGYLWPDTLSFQIRMGDRICIKGKNGSGKSTLIRILLGLLSPTVGSIHRADFSTVYIDQDYSLIRNGLTVFEQAQEFNRQALQEHEVKIRLNRFLFNREFWDRPCSLLSGGEKMRLTLCCLMISNRTPDFFILDEPTNNLDIENAGILTSAIQEYQGTLLVVSHDRYFIAETGISKELDMNGKSGSADDGLTEIL